MKSTPTLKILAIILLGILSQTSISQTFNVEPPYWWTGMERSQLELMIYAENAGKMEVSLQYPGVVITKTTRVRNPNYLFLLLSIDPTAQAGKLEISMRHGKNTKLLQYELKDKSTMAIGAAGLDPSDFIYLIFPDRFANGNPNNDRIDGMRDQSLDRNELFHRHGGDLAGISQHLDYIEELGVTALWINPVVTNDQPFASYHGYAATDLYRIDPRFGSNTEYKALVKQCHQRGIKVITDIVYNHWGDQHPIYQDLPDSSWINFHDEFTRTSYRATTLFDPYAHPADRQIFNNGWFDAHMPDLNQQNPHLASYLIQHSIWWIGHFGVDAFRIDTYAYPDQLFMRDLMQAIRLEYPDFFCFGETWVHGTPVQAWFTEKNGTLKAIDSHLQSVTDFQLYYATLDALNQPFGWTEGSSRLYYTLVKDILYKDASRNVTFLDNHDLSRVYSMLGEDIVKLKMAIGFMMTTRGIPSLYYGTEIGLKNFADPDGKVRQDFPGGWAGDSLNLFVPSGRQGETKEIFDFTAKLAHYRKANPELFRGKLTHFVPEQGVYVYLREGGGKKLMVIFNPTENGGESLKMDRFSSELTGFSEGHEILSDRKIDFADATLLNQRGIQIIELR